MENVDFGDQTQKPNNEQAHNLDKVPVAAKSTDQGKNGNNGNGHTGGNEPPPGQPWFWTTPFWSEGKRIALSLIFDFLRSHFHLHVLRLATMEGHE
jgi:hypothetical protein